MERNIAMAKGIEPCPICGSAEVRWRRRGPADIALTWMRALVEWIWSGVVGRARTKRRQGYMAEQALVDTASLLDEPEIQAEMLEAETAHKTPKRFWQCRGCGQEGSVF